MWRRICYKDYAIEGLITVSSNKRCTHIFVAVGLNGNVNPAASAAATASGRSPPPSADKSLTFPFAFVAEPVNG